MEKRKSERQEKEPWEVHQDDDEEIGGRKEEPKISIIIIKRKSLT